ncbi:Os03g0251800, partial [Oryza sativa Japonica Group]
ARPAVPIFSTATHGEKGRQAGARLWATLSPSSTGRTTERSWAWKTGAAGTGGGRLGRSWVVALRHERRCHQARPAVPIFSMMGHGEKGRQAGARGVVTELDQPSPFSHQGTRKRGGHCRR